jgi:hypothetical protein
VRVRVGRDIHKLLSQQLFDEFYRITNVKITAIWYSVLDEIVPALLNRYDQKFTTKSCDPILEEEVLIIVINIM